jgi:hypothetical protein
LFANGIKLARTSTGNTVCSKISHLVLLPYKSQYYRIHPELPKDLSIYTTKYCSGRFYFLSWEAVFNLSNKKVLIENEYLEDYAIGYYLSSYLKTNILDITVDKYFKDC